MNPVSPPASFRNIAVSFDKGPTRASAAGQGTRPTKLVGEHFVFIDVAPHPVLTRLDGLYDRVAGGVKVFGGVLVFGGIAAAYVSAGAAQAQMHPGVAGL